MTPEQLHLQFSALVLAGEITAEPGTLAMWQQVRESEPTGWREMMEHVVLSGGRDLLITLACRRGTGWGCHVSLGEEPARRVRGLPDRAAGRWQ